jgi:hypothetical protein
MSLFAKGVSWIVFLSTGYVWFRLGWLAALAYLVIPLAVSLLVQTGDIIVLRVGTRPLALVSTPIAVVAFVMLMWSLTLL